MSEAGERGVVGGGGHRRPGGLGARSSLSWQESAGRICIAIWLTIPGIVLASGSVARLSEQDPALPILTGAGFAAGIVQIIAGVLAGSGRPTLALVYLGITALLQVGALASVTRANPGSAASEQELLANLVLPLACLGWAIGRRIHGKGSGRARALTFLMLAAFSLSLPSLGRRMGRSVGALVVPAHGVRKAATGVRLPPLRFLDESGGEVVLDDPGVIYVVNFWATWCGPCLKELPALMDLVTLPEREGHARLIAVNTEDISSHELGEFLASEGLEDLTAFRDPEGYRELLGSGRIPLTVVMRDRELVVRYEGYSSRQIRELGRVLDRLKPPREDQAGEGLSPPWPVE